MHEQTIPYNTTVVRRVSIIHCVPIGSKKTDQMYVQQAFSDGTVVTYEKRERPQIVWDKHTNPIWLVTGVVVPHRQHDDPSRPWWDGNGYFGTSFTLVQPIRQGTTNRIVDNTQQVGSKNGA